MRHFQARRIQKYYDFTDKLDLVTILNSFYRCYTEDGIILLFHVKQLSLLQMNYQTSPADLSFVYGANEQQNHQIRAYSKGLLKTNKTNDGYFVFPAYVESCPFGGINPTAGSPCYAYGMYHTLVYITLK